jgi:hypothetical protein
MTLDRIKDHRKMNKMEKTEETGTRSRWLSGMRGFTVVWIG